MSYGIIFEKDGKEILRNEINFDGNPQTFFRNRAAYVAATGWAFPEDNTVYVDGHMVSSRPIGSKKDTFTNDGMFNSWSSSVATYKNYARRETTVGEMAPVEMRLTAEMHAHLDKMEISYYPESMHMSIKQMHPIAGNEDFVIYPKGFGLNIDKINHGVFSSNPAFFVKFTKKYMKSGSICASAQRSIKEILKLLKTHSADFKFLSRENGYKFGICPVSLLYIEDYIHNLMEMTPRKLKTEIGYWDSVLELLAEINACAEEDAVADAPYGNTVAEEILIRMKSLAMLSDVITDFRDRGTIKMSEFRGALYNLSEEGQKAVAEVKEKGFTPYHVIKSGPLYTVLYVGSDKDAWEDERYSQKNHGTLLAYVYNSEQPFCSELGYVTVAPSSGGVTRLA